MALPSIRSLAAAQKLVQSLNSATSQQTRLDITALITEDNWLLFVQAKYPQYLIEQAKKECQDPNGSLLQWWNPTLELATAINCCIIVLRKGGDPEVLSELREVALKYFLKPMLSRDPKVGLRALAPSIREQELVNPNPPGCFSCIQIASALVSAIYISLQEKPDPALSKIFKKSEALEISLIVWYYTLEESERNLAANILVHIMHGELAHGSIAWRWSGLFFFEQIADKCKEILQAESESGSDEPVNLHLVNLIFKPGHPECRFGITFCTEEVHKVVFDVINRELHRPVINWGRMQHAGSVLSRFMEAEAGDSGETVIVIEYAKQLEVLNLISRIFLDESGVDDQAKAGILRIFTMIAHCGDCSNLKCPCWGRSPPFIQCVKPALEKDQLKTLIQLRDALKGKSDKNLTTRRDRIVAWLEMGLAVGLKEDHPHDGCYWRECETHTNLEGKLDSQLLKCAKCKVARYCSRECQTKDWKDGHKLACR